MPLLPPTAQPTPLPAPELPTNHPSLPNATNPSLIPTQIGCPLGSLPLCQSMLHDAAWQEMRDREVERDAATALRSPAFAEPNVFARMLP